MDKPADTSEFALEQVAALARHGSVWMITATGVAKAFGVIAQLVLASLLPRKDFGVFAIAVSLSVLLSVFRDGGLPMVLLHKSRRFNAYAGPVFWLMLTINSVTGLAIAAIAIPASHLYHEPELAPVIFIFALTVPMCVPAAIMLLRLSSELRFRELGIIQFVSAMLRNALLLLFAWAGLGARSFILPLVFTSITDTAMLWYVTRYSPWRLPARVNWWPKLMKSGRWVLLGTFAIALGNNGAYFILGKYLPSEVLGIYFFAFQIVVQLGTLLSDNLYQVLFASFVRMAHDLSHLRVAVLRSLNAVMLLSASASMAIGVVFEPLERLLWHGKWAAATGAVHVFCLIWPAAAGASVLRALQAATGKFNVLGIVSLVTAFYCVTGSVLGAFLTPTATAAAIGFSIATLLASSINARVSLSPLHIGALETARTTLIPWLTVVVAAVISCWLGTFLVKASMQMLASGVSFCILLWLGARWFAGESTRLLISSVRKAIIEVPAMAIRRL
jgi:O-antigen/teichoic acid export membrane protein